MMLCYSFPFFLHIDVVNIITKRNWLSECDSLCFLIIQSDIVEPHLLTYKPSEHRNDMLIGMQREFTVRDFFIILNKIHLIWTAMEKIDFKPQKPASRYAAMLASSLTKNRSVGYLGPVKIQASDVKYPLLQVYGFNFSGVIWEYLMSVLNHTDTNMRGFLKERFGVK